MKMKNLLAAAVAAAMVAAVGPVAAVPAGSPSSYNLHRCGSHLVALNQTTGQLVKFNAPEKNSYNLLVCCPDNDPYMPCSTPFYRQGMGPANNWGGCGVVTNVIITGMNAHACIN